MTKLALIAFTSALSLAVAGCGDADDASEAAQADTVEMPADEALANTPDPAASAAVEDAAAAAEAEAEEATANDAADAAAAAAADASAAADAAEGIAPEPTAAE